MSSFLIELWSTEISYTVVPFKEISLCPYFIKSSDAVSKKCIPTYVMLSLKFANLCFIYTQVTFITIVM